MAVGVGDERPGQAEDPRVSGERSVQQLGQLAVETGREVDADLANLLLDHVKIIDQPVGRGVTTRCSRAAATVAW